MDGLERAHECRVRFCRRADHEVFPVRHAALETARVVGLAVKTSFLIMKDLVVNQAPRCPRDTESHADLDTLDGLDGSHGRTKLGGKPPVVMHEADKPRRHPL